MKQKHISQFYTRAYLGELYARAFLRDGEPHPVEPVIDSSRLVNLSLCLNLGTVWNHNYHI